MVEGAYARSSARVSANGEPFDRTRLVEWTRELFAEPTPAPAQIDESTTADTPAVSQGR
jgi:hypothetical protein